MKKAFALLFILAISLQGFSTAPQKDGKEKLSPFVGKWDWAWNDKAHIFFVWCGERNDSLLFAIGGTFFYGDRIHMPEHGKDGVFATGAGIYVQRGIRHKLTVVKPQGFTTVVFNAQNIKTFHREKPFLTNIFISL